LDLGFCSSVVTPLQEIKKNSEKTPLTETEKKKKKGSEKSVENPKNQKVFVKKRKKKKEENKFTSPRAASFLCFPFFLQI
jgi:hypothetical protein